ncbi:MAG: helix-hairpin-helix domain-containing protein [Bacteroidetes bacterium]|nr:helix-hairpin-helix domain-containing protein [Bacteroidota bacterium]
MIKNLNKYLLQLIFLILVFQFKAIAQTDDEQLKIIEKHIENIDFAGDYNELSDFIGKKNKEKLNINKVTPFQLYSLGFLSYNQINSIINHRKKYGDFVSLNELQTIDSLPEDIIKKLKLHLFLNETYEKFNILKSLNESEKNLSIFSKVTTPYSKGYIDKNIDSANKFLGTPFISRIKFKVDYNEKLMVGFNAEKDAGEEFFTGSNKKGYDFYSGYFFIRNTRKFESFAIGDFKADFGQGLVISGGLNTGKNALVTNIKKTNTGIRPYNSFNENDFLRGSAVTFCINKTRITFLISKNKNDATFDTINNSGSDMIFIKNIDPIGYHRTAKEIANKNSHSEFMTAQNLTYTLQNLNIGLTSLYRKSLYGNTPNDMLYNKYYFTSSQFYKVGLNWDYYYKNINFYGESAISNNKSAASICGVNISIGDFADISTIYRNYSKDFIVDYTNAFSENTKPMNERGLYSGILIFPSSKIQLSAFYDFYKMPWYTYFVDGTGMGNDGFFEAKYQADKTNLIYFRIRKKTELKNYNEGYFNSLKNEEKTYIRIHAEKEFSPVITAKFRIEISKIKPQTGVLSKGFLFFTDLSLKKAGNPLSINSRFTLFNSTDYSSGIYAMENDLLHTWSVPKFYDSGAKFYILLKVKFKKINVQYKYSYIKYYNKQTIGSGLSEINSNNVQENSLLLNYTIN